MRVSVPLVGFVLFLLFFPLNSKTLVVQITVEIMSLMLAGLYAFLLWRSIMISGYPNVIRLSIDGWLGTLMLIMTAALAVMGARLLWERTLRRSTFGDRFPAQCLRQAARAVDSSASPRVIAASIAAWSFGGEADGPFAA